jgi:signal transduction histidine kinase
MNRIPTSLKNIGIWILVIGVGLILTALLFFSVISIYIGFKHSVEKGFWMPILTGVLVFIGSSWLSWNLIKYFFRELRSKEITLD